jgi:aminoglycoside 3-N-acetyltransferase IV
MRRARYGGEGAMRVLEVLEQLRRLGVEEGGVLLVHTSFRAVRPIDGGPAGLISALRQAVGVDGTLVMPSWTESDTEPFHPLRTPAATDLGVVADTFWRLPDVLRSAHAFAFAAAGPEAAGIVADPLPLPPHRAESPVGRVHDLDGQILLLGVEHDANTTIHLAEVLAGVPYGVPKHALDMQDGVPVRVDYLENDHCCQRFALAGEWLEENKLQKQGPVGHGTARLVRSRDVVRVTCERLRRDPLLFLHDPSDGCEECDDARASIRSP